MLFAFFDELTDTGPEFVKNQGEFLKTCEKIQFFKYKIAKILAILRVL